LQARGKPEWESECGKEVRGKKAHCLALPASLAMVPPATQGFIVRMRGNDEDGFHSWAFEFVR
jgi:hypothetical protein